jgi:hypothetical protein
VSSNEKGSASHMADFLTDSYHLPVYIYMIKRFMFRARASSTKEIAKKLLSNEDAKIMMRVVLRTQHLNRSTYSPVYLSCLHAFGYCDPC